ncbi:MAG: hypothetical protein ACWGHH_03930 [Sulfurovaceae bacterium]
MKNSIVNHYKIYVFRDRDQFLGQIRDKHKILVAMNTKELKDKILLFANN